MTAVATVERTTPSPDGAMTRRPVYLDHHATTPLDPRVLKAMLPFLTEEFGNAASAEHRFGWMAERAVEAARAGVARLVGARPRDVVLTSGATEANNLALLGLPMAAGDHVITTVLEHASVNGPLEELARRGVRITRVAAGADGRVRAEDVAAEIEPTTRLVSVTAANHEIGTIQPLTAIGEVARERGVPLHVDASQAAGKIPLDVGAAGIGLLTLSAHKIYGPKGIGALVAAPAVRGCLRPLLHGGGQEGGLRPGTVPVPLAVGFGAACDLAREGMERDARRLGFLHLRLLDHLLAIPGLRVHGATPEKLPGSLNVGWPGFVSADLLYDLRDEVAASSGSACGSAEIRPSPTLLAIGLTEEAAQGGLRLAVGRFTTTEEVDRAAKAILRAAHDQAATQRSGTPAHGT